MNTKFHFLRGALPGVAATAALLFAGLTASFAASEIPEHKHESAAHHQEWLKERLDQTAERLEIKASQQNAWQAYAKSVEALGSGPGNGPDETADATTIARFHADKAAEFAKKLKLIADATAKLQSTLTPDQRKTLDQIVRQAAHHEMGHPASDEMMPGMHGMHEHHGAMGADEHDHCEHHDGKMGEAPPAP